jgi:hypothetical protein
VTEKNSDGSPKPDPENPGEYLQRYSGRVTVELLTADGVRKECLFPNPSGQSDFMGGLPVEDSIVVIGFLPRGISIVLASYPPSFRDLVDIRGLLSLDKGEKLIQASEVSGFTPSGSHVLQTKTSRIYLDRYGRVIIENKNIRSRIILGNLDTSLNPYEEDSQGNERPKDPSDNTATDDDTGDTIAMRLEILDSGGNVKSYINFDEEGGIVDYAAHRVIKSNDLELGEEGLGSDNYLVIAKFLTEVFNSHGHNYLLTVGPAGAVQGDILGPDSIATSAHRTSKVKGK